jgi:glycosyltransferase involved in cell wall biosynthesis
MSSCPPRVSVCLPTYNGGRFIRAAIESVLAQSLADFELIVCDDASTDGTLAQVTGLHDSRLRVFRNSHRLGLVGNWNRCLELVVGEYVVLMHQDDLMHCENLAMKVELLDLNPQVGFVHSNIRRIDERGQVVSGHWLSQSEADVVEPGMLCFQRMLLAGNFICCPSVMVRRNCLAAMGDFDARLSFTVDMEMWLRLSTRYDVGYLAKPLIDYRVHDAQETQRYADGREINEIARATRIALDEHLQPGALPGLRRQARLNLVRLALRQARWRARCGHVGSSARYIVAASQVLIGHLPFPDRGADTPTGRHVSFYGVR